MKDVADRTKQTYEESADGLAEYFKGIGPREEDITRAFEKTHRIGKTDWFEMAIKRVKESK